MSESTVAQPSEKQTTGGDTQWEEAVAVTGRPNDVPSPNTTLADRAKVRKTTKPDDVPDATVVTAPKKQARKQS